MPHLTLVAPLHGWSGSLDEVPDPVFSGRMLGDGVAIDPLGGTLHAPCDGELIVVPASRHAITLRTVIGAEILMHVGIDTVALGGEGFELHVREGERVVSGQPLLSFDLDWLARRARSLLTPVLVIEGGSFVITRKRQDCELKAGDFLMELSTADAVQATTTEPGAGEMSRRIIVPLEHGIHARPAAQLAGCAKRFTAGMTVLAHGRRANARSAVSLMSLGARKGDEIVICATGFDAEKAIEAFAATMLMEVGARELTVSPVARTELRAGDGTGARASAAREMAVSRDTSAPDVLHPDSASQAASKTIRGVVASRGLAVGRAVQIGRPQLHVNEAGAGVAHEAADLARARAVVRMSLLSAQQSVDGPRREIIAAHLELIDDPELLATAQALIAKGKSAGFAWRKAIQGCVAALHDTGDERLAERADDLLDLESQLLLALSGQAPAASIALPERAILVAHELLPSQLVTLDPQRIAGICTAAGGPTSHVSILAASMGIPALVAAGSAVLGISDGVPLVLDADQGILQVDPDRAELEAAEKALTAQQTRRAAERAAAQRECRTADGVRIEVFANTGSLAEAQLAVECGAEGCGLLRTEFLFLDRETAPDEAEQFAQYQKIADAFAGRPLVIRTLDVGADKPLAYLPLPAEENPALGLRGVRASLWNPEFLRAQLRAILRVQPHEQCKLLLPMITSAAEVRAIRAMLDEIRRDIGRRVPIDVGVMIETPAAALTADQIAIEADFFSIGTNDLTQYTLAMDRGHPELAAQIDSLHPAVLRLIARTAEAARARQRTVAVCGSLASDPIAAPILIGLGVTELSVVPAAVARVKAVVLALTSDECRQLAQRALEAETAEAVRSLVLASSVGCLA